MWDKAVHSQSIIQQLRSNNEKPSIFSAFASPCVAPRVPEKVYISTQMTKAYRLHPSPRYYFVHLWNPTCFSNSKYNIKLKASPERVKHSRHWHQHLKTRLASCTLSNLSTKPLPPGPFFKSSSLSHATLSWPSIDNAFSSLETLSRLLLPRRESSSGRRPSLAAHWSPA